LLVEKYDLIITDVQMPVMDGLETTLAIRALPDDEFDNRNLYIVALTASALEEEYNKCFEVGMNDVILKPIDIEKLSDSLSRAYEKIQEYRAEKV
jgi:CheY-like chemotaxis protein